MLSFIPVAVDLSDDVDRIALLKRELSAKHTQNTFLNSYNSYNIHWKQIHETGQLGQYDVITVRRKHAFCFVF